MKFSNKSLELIKYALDRVDIYAIDNFSYKHLSNDVGARKDFLNEIRFSWMYSRTGFYNQLFDHSKFLMRVLEYAIVRDFLKTLRQRTNIIHEMMKVEFKSYVPVHISISPRDLEQQSLVLDNVETQSGKDFFWIIHPGQTRAQAGVFSRHNLDNVLLYLPKKHSTKILLKNFSSIKKINGPDDLIKCYRTYRDHSDGIIDLNFHLNQLDVENGLKVHNHLYETKVRDKDGNLKFIREHIKLPILKAINIKPYIQNGNNEPLHPNSYYITNSFLSYNKYVPLVLSKNLSIYSNSPDNEIKEAISRNRNKLLNIENGEKLFRNSMECIDSFEPTMQVVVEELKEHFKEEYLIKFFTDLNTFFNENKEVTKYEEKNNIKQEAITFEPNFIELQEKIEYKNIVEKNKFKGVCIWIDSSVIGSFFRDPYELLFFINSDISITKSQDNKLAIINCEHEYWKTGENYKEWKLTKEMYSE